MSPMTARTATRRPSASPSVGRRPADRSSPCAPGSTERLRRLRGGAPATGLGEAGPSAAEAPSGPPTGIPGILLTGPPAGARSDNAEPLDEVADQDHKSDNRKPDQYTAH